MRETRPVAAVRRRPRSGRWPLLLVLAGGAAVLLWWLAAVGRPVGPAAGLPNLSGFSTVFLGIFIEAVPFVLLGVVASSALHLFVSADRLARLIPRRVLPATVGGALLGLVFPVCECGVVPVSRRLMRKGAPVSLGIAFLLAAPVVNPIVIVSTWVAFGDWRMVAWRVGLTLLVAVAVGLIFATHQAPHQLLAPAAAAHDHDHVHHPAAWAGPGDRLREVIWHSGAEFVEMSRYLIVGALLAAAMQTYVPRGALLALGDAPLSAILVMMGLAVLLSVCSTVDAFIALSFAGVFGPGALLGFLVFGPMIDVKATLMFLSVFRRRAVALLILLVFQMVLLGALVCGYTWG